MHRVGEALGEDLAAFGRLDYVQGAGDVVRADERKLRWMDGVGGCCWIGWGGGSITVASGPGWQWMRGCVARCQALI